MVDLFGEPSSDSDGTLILSGDPRSWFNSLLTAEEILALPDTTVPRDRWVPGFGDRVPRSEVDVSTWSARRVTSISLSVLDIDLFYHYFSKPKGYIFPVQQGKIRTPPKSFWSSQLIMSTKINQFYDQQPSDVYNRTVRPISFESSGWFEKLFDAYQGFVDCHRQALWKASHFLWISPA